MLRRVFLSPTNNIKMKHRFAYHSTSTDIHPVDSKQISLSTGVSELSMSGVPPGIYHIQANIDQQNIRIGKIVVVH